MVNLSKKTRKTIVFFVAIFIAAIAITHIFMKGYVALFVLTTIQNIVEKKTGGDLLIGSVDISLLPTALIIKNIRFSLDDQQEISLNIDEISTKINLIKLLGGNIAMNNLTIKEPGLQLKAEAETLSEFIGPKKSKKKMSSYLFRPSIKKLKLTDGNIDVVLGENFSFNIKNIVTKIQKNSKKQYMFEIAATAGKIKYKEIGNNLSDITILGVLGKSSIEIIKMTSNLDEDKISGNALISFDKKKKVIGHIVANAPLDIVELFLKKKLQVTGSAKMNSYFTYNKEELKLSTDFIVKKGSLSGLPFKGLNAEIFYKKGVLNLKKVVLKAMNGSSSLNGWIDNNSKRYKFNYIFNDMEISEITDRYGIKMASGLSGTVTGNGSLKPLSFKGDITTKSEGFLALDGLRKTSPLSLSSEVQINGKDITLSDGTLFSNELAASFHGKVQDLKELDMSVVLEFQEISKLSFLFGQSFTGDAKIEGNLSGSLLKPEFSGYADIKNPVFNKFSAKRIIGDIAFANGLIETNKISVSGKESLFNIGGKIILRPKAPELDISISIPYAELSDLVAMTGKDYPISGKLKGSIKIKNTIKTPYVSTDLTIKKGELFNESFDQLQVKGSYKSHQFKLDKVKISKKGGTVITDGTFDLKKPFNMNLVVKKVQIEDINYFKKHINIRGLADGKFKVSGRLKKPVIETDATLLNGFIYGEEIKKLHISGVYKDGSIAVKHVNLTNGEGTIVANEMKNKEDKTFLAIKIDNYDIAKNAYLKEKIPDLTSKLYLEGELYSRINIKNLNSSTAELTVNNMKISTEKSSYSSIQPFKVSYIDSNSKVESFSIDGVNGTISLNGDIDANGLIDADIIGATKVSGLSKYLKGVTKIGGILTFDAQIGGTSKKPAFKALLTTQDGMVRFKGFPYDLSGIESQLTLTPDLLSVESLEGILQKQSFTGGGLLTFKNLKPDNLNFFFDIGEVRLRYPDWLSSRGKGRITVTGKGRDITLGGELEILRASYTEDINLNEMIKKAISKDISMEKATEGKHGLKFNLNFKADDNIVVKNNLADIELKGSLTIAGETPHPSLLGELETLRGKIIFRNDEFTITKGTVSFNDPEKITPYFKVNAVSEVKNYRINFDVAGTPQSYEVRLSSDPPLEENEIVSILSFGYTGSELRGKDTKITSLETAALLFQDEIETKVKKYFGFDRFRIDPYYSESTGSTEARVSVSKKLNEDLTATYSRGISKNQVDELYLGYSFSDNIAFLGSWSSRKEAAGAFGGDVILRYEFQ